MTPSKDWMTIEDYVNDPLYVEGVDNFLDYAFQKLKTSTIRCPCCQCMNGESGNREKVREHLLVFGVVKRYTFWYHHGEELDETQLDSDDEADGRDHEDHDEMLSILQDLHPEYHDGSSPIGVNNVEEPNADTKKFYSLLKDSQDPVYEGCKSSRMSALLKLLHIKTLGRWSNESFTMLLDFLKKELLPEGSNLPDSYYESKKIMKDLGLSYERIDACVNDCMLYWKDNEKLDACNVCGASRWKSNKHNGEDKCKKNGKRIPHKTLRYFPLKPRLQRLFMCSKTASLMTWYHGKKKKDGTMRHPVDGSAWESFDKEFPDFASDPRNVRLGLASDGFQPFANSKTNYSIWPVVLIPYNLPPELCMKQSNMILSMLIPGPKGPGNAIDVYLQPLIEELNDLWATGVNTFDAATQHHFQLRAALMWTINDFPAYDFQKRSERNSVNRSKYPKALMPRTGSKPIRQIIWDDLGGSKGNKPTLVDVFYTTRKKGNSLPNAETIQKHAEIQETMEKDPSLSYVQVAQKVFKSKSRDRVVGLGGGITLKDMIGPQPSREELQIELTATQKKNEDLTNHVETIQEENTELKSRMGLVEAEMKMLKDTLIKQFNASFSNNGSNTQTPST